MLYTYTLIFELAAVRYFPKIYITNLVSVEAVFIIYFSNCCGRIVVCSMCDKHNLVLFPSPGFIYHKKMSDCLELIDLRGRENEHIYGMSGVVLGSIQYLCASRIPVAMLCLYFPWLPSREAVSDWAEGFLMAVPFWHGAVCLQRAVSNGRCTKCCLLFARCKISLLISQPWWGLSPWELQCGQALGAETFLPCSRRQ